MLQSIQLILKKENSYKVTGSLWMECENEKFFGPGRMELLEHIDKTGSINKAAKAMAMSYKKAWEMINQINKQAAQPLVISQSGGEQGGGSIITDEAKELIIYFKELRKRFIQFLNEESKYLKTNSSKKLIKAV